MPSRGYFRHFLIVSEQSSAETTNLIANVIVSDASVWIERD